MNTFGTLAAALAGLVISSSSFATEQTPPTKAAKAVADKKASEKGECHGINSCKGKGECGGPGWDCAGNNTCKGKGWISMTSADCKKKGGKFKAESAGHE